MPSRNSTLQSRTTTEVELDRELEALGLRSAPALAGDDRSELVERVEISAGPRRRGAPPTAPQDGIDRAVDRAVRRRQAHTALGMPSDRRISNEMIDELLAGASTDQEVAGPGGLLAELTKRLVERAMEVELTDHVGYEPHQEPPGGGENTRNGTSPKTLICEHGRVAIDAPRDRDGSFAPKIVKKRLSRHRCR